MFAHNKNLQMWEKEGKGLSRHRTYLAGVFKAKIGNCCSQQVARHFIDACAHYNIS